MSSATTERLTCPFCDYQNSADSIEAHISGMTDEAHKGRVGKNWREAIQAEPAEKPVPVEESEMARLDAALESERDSPEFESAESAGRAVLLGTLVLAGLMLLATTTTDSDPTASSSSEQDLDDLGGLGA